jgi:hypothetical protein
MCKPFLGHAALDPRNSVPDLPCHIVDSSDKFVRIHFQLFGLSAPVADLDIAEAVFPAEFHGQLDALKIDLAVREYTRQIV